MRRPTHRWKALNEKAKMGGYQQTSSTDTAPACPSPHLPCLKSKLGSPHLPSRGTRNKDATKQREIAHEKSSVFFAHLPEKPRRERRFGASPRENFGLSRASRRDSIEHAKFCTGTPCTLKTCAYMCTPPPHMCTPPPCQLLGCVARSTEASCRSLLDAQIGNCRENTFIHLIRRRVAG